MIKLFDKKQIVLTFITFLISTMSWGQSPATFSGGGSGTEADPWVILTREDWNGFAASVNADKSYDYDGKYIKLGANISVDQMVGNFSGSGQFYVADHFCGVFDGNWHTIDIDIHGEPEYAGPFALTDGATIKNLIVTGKISTTGQYAGSIVSCVENNSGRETNIINCTSSVEILIDTKVFVDNRYHGGLVGWLNIGELDFENCIFEGSIVGIKNGENYISYANNCAGFVGFINSESASVKYKNCTQAHTLIAHNGSTTFGTFHLPADFAPSDVTGQNSPWGTAYYIHRINNSDRQGVAAYDNAPINKISRKYIRKLAGGNDETYYVPAAVIEIPDDYTFYGSIYYPTVTYYGKALELNEDYEVESSDERSLIIIKGKNELNEEGYAGEVKCEIALNDISSWRWANLQYQLGKNSSQKIVITLDKDYVCNNGYQINVNNTTITESALVVKGNVVLDLNNHTLDRNLYNYDPDSKGYVLSVESTTKLIINGPGVITGGNNKGVQGNNSSRGDGGGIHVVSGGELTLKCVTISGNKVIRSNNANTGCTYWGTGAGIYNKGTLNVYDCTIINNIADGGGGGICSQSSLIMERTLIANNTAQSKGGGLRINSGTRITDCCIRNNVLEFMHFNPDPDDEDGGGIYFDRNTGTATLTNCVINSNNAQWRGGGILVNSATINMVNCEMKYNSALGDENLKGSFGATGGGGAFVYKGTLNLNNTEITDNTSYTTGGVYLGNYQNNSTTLKVTGKTIIDNNIGDAAKPNVFIEDPAKVIVVYGALDKDALIGVSRKGETESNITSGLNGQNAGSNFRSDNYKLYWFTLNHGEVKLQLTLYWDQINWDGSNSYCYKDNESKEYRIAAPVIVNTKIDNLDNNYNIAFKDKSGHTSSKAAIFIDQTKEKIGNSWVQHDGQLIYKKTPVKVTVLRNIDAAKIVKNDTCGWYTISSPVDNPNLLHNTNLITAVSQPYNFDLLRFDATNQGFPWQTYVAHPEFTTLENGIGYLYRNAKSFVEESNGNMITGSVNITVYEGWNLIGNPYTHDIKKGKTSDCAIENGKLLAEGYYQLANNGVWTVNTSLSDGSLIKMGEGLLVKAEYEGEIGITNVAPSNQRANDEYIQFIVANSDYEDATYAVFNDGYGLDKINHRNTDCPMIYINQNGKDYAIATMSDEIKSFNLNFKAKTTGKYTLRYKTEGNFSNLHVIDRLTGKDIDMLVDEEYSFIGSPKDTDARFLVRFNYTSGDANNDIFAYQSESDIVVYGEGELQVFDVTGRHIMTTTINGVETINAPSSGVYILRLLGNEIKTQKIVVR